MIIVLPLSHERMEAQRLPYITIGIIVINVFLYIITAMVVPKTQEEMKQHGQELVEYCLSHPYLDIPAETLKKFPKDIQNLIKFQKEVRGAESAEDTYRQRAITDEALDTLGTGESEAKKAPPQSWQERSKELRQQEQARLDELVQAFEKTIKNDFYMKYGYVPARGGVFTIFSSIFLHGGILHLVFNMLFLWLSGCNVEDLWGRVIYPIFYLLGGVIATLAHGMMFPASSIPLIGASGAIAAVMGAFLVRLYDTKIHFVYLLWISLRPKIGRFSAPAYLMLPLWLLQQLWEAFMSSGGGSGVAFWAHIGGFAFGALVATLIKVTGFEAKYIAPVLDKKTAVLDEHLASGMTKLQEGDVDEALRELKEAAQHNPDDPMVHSELSRAYFKKGKKDLALREFKRAVYIYMKQNRMDEAVAEYLELSSELPEMSLDPPQQMKIAVAIENRALKAWKGISAEKTASVPGQKKDPEEETNARDLFAKATVAYRQLISHYQRVAQTLESRDAIEALTHYGDICVAYLDQPQEAYKAYKMILQSSQLAPEKRQEFQAKAQQAAQMASERAKKAELLKKQQAEEAKRAAAVKLQEKTQQTAVSAAPKAQKSKPDIPIQKRIKLVPETAAPAKYQVGSVSPLEANKVSPVPGGLDLKRPSEAPLLFRKISVICVAQVPEITQRVKQVKKKGGKVDYVKSDEKRENIVADIFLSGQSRPYRIATDRIAYPQFFPKLLPSALDNFRQFMLYLISQIDSVYLDQGTLNFLKTGKPRIFSSQEDLEIHEKIFWKQLMGALRFQCEQCWEVYWIDGSKIPEAGVQTKCTKCGNPVVVQK